jgi:hypothetical protein
MLSMAVPQVMKCHGVVNPSSMTLLAKSIKAACSTAKAFIYGVVVRKALKSTFLMALLAVLTGTHTWCSQVSLIIIVISRLGYRQSVTLGVLGLTDL